MFALSIFLHEFLDLSRHGVRGFFLWFLIFIQVVVVILFASVVDYFFFYHFELPLFTVFAPLLLLEQDGIGHGSPRVLHSKLDSLRAHRSPNWPSL